MQTISPAWKTKTPALGIDLGGTKLAAAVVVDSKLATEPRRIPTPAGRDNIVEAIITFIEEFRKEHLIAGVGIATAGIVDPISGQIMGSTGNLPGWEGTSLKKIIEGRTLLPVHVENDANAAAYGECQVQQLQDKTCVVTVTLGTGIGGGIVIDGKLYRGAVFAAGECGHIRIAMDNKRLCTCGLWDCWEAYASGRGLLTTAERLLTDANVENSELGLKDGDMTTQDVVEAASRKDVLALRAMAQWHEHICTGMIGLAHTLNPDVFVISGGMARFVDLDLLRELLSDRTLPRVAESLDIRLAVLGNAAGMVGAADLVLDAMAAKR